MSGKNLFQIAAIFLTLSGAGIASNEAKAATKASLTGCQVSRKGTKIRCPHGMFIRQDVVDRKIASEKAGVKKKPVTKNR